MVAYLLPVIEIPLLGCAEEYQICSKNHQFEVFALDRAKTVKRKWLT